MPQVIFYILSESRPTDFFICQLAAKIWQHGDQQLLILARDQEHQKQIDERLWTYSDISFIPHGIEETNIDPAIVISVRPDNRPHQILMNLSGAIPEKMESYTKILEIVSAHAEDKSHARERYRYYQDHGFKIENHNIP